MRESFHIILVSIFSLVEVWLRLYSMHNLTFIALFDIRTFDRKQILFVFYIVIIVIILYVLLKCNLLILSFTKKHNFPRILTYMIMLFDVKLMRIIYKKFSLLFFCTFLFGCIGSNFVRIKSLTICFSSFQLKWERKVFIF